MALSTLYVYLFIYRRDHYSKSQVQAETIHHNCTDNQPNQAKTTYHSVHYFNYTGSNCRSRPSYP